MSLIEIDLDLSGIIIEVREDGSPLDKGKPVNGVGGFDVVGLREYVFGELEFVKNGQVSRCCLFWGVCIPCDELQMLTIFLNESGDCWKVEGKLDPNSKESIELKPEGFPGIRYPEATVKRMTSFTFLEVEKQNARRSIVFAGDDVFIDANVFPIPEIEKSTT